jgi:PST family polysaccharide transporter
VTTLGLDYAVIRSYDSWTKVVSTGTLLRVLFSVSGIVIVAAFSEEISALFGLSGFGIPIVVASLTVILSALSFPPQMDLTKSLQFRKLSVSKMTSSVVWCVLAVSLTYLGLSYWSLVLSLIPSQISGLAVLYLQSPQRSTREVSTRVARNLLKFGGVTSVGLLLALFSVSIDKIIVGSILGSASLGIYWAMFQYGNLAPSWLTGVINTVMFPTYVALDGQPAALRKAYTETLRYASEFAGLFSFGIAGASPLFVNLILGEKWNDGVTILSILAIGGYFTALTSPAGNVFVSQRKPQLTYQIALAFLIPMIIFLVISTNLYGLPGASVVILFHATIMCIYVIHRASGLLGINTLDILKGFLPSATAGIAAAICIYIVSFGLERSFFSLATAIIIGTAVYSLLATALSGGKFAEDVREGIRIVRRRRS